MKKTRNVLFIAAALSMTTVISSAKDKVQAEQKKTTAVAVQSTEPVKKGAYGNLTQVLVAGEQSMNVRIVGNGVFNPNASAPVEFYIELTGPLAGKQITSAEWVLPEGWEIGNIPNERIVLYYKPGAVAGNLSVSFVVDGNKYSASKFLTISRVLKP